MKTIFEANIPGIEVTGEATPSATGAFEVVAQGVDQPLHSKLNGQGYLDTDMDKLKLVIEELKKLSA